MMMTFVFLRSCFLHSYRLIVKGCIPAVNVSHAVSDWNDHFISYFLSHCVKDQIVTLSKHANFYEIQEEESTIRLKTCTHSVVLFETDDIDHNIHTHIV